MPLRFAVFLFALAGCDGWPLYANLPEDGVDRIDVSELPVGGGDGVEWTELPSPLEDGSDDDPRLVAAETVGAAAGNWFPARITGSGWDPTQTAVERWEDCGDVAQFPPYDNGNYLGDVDWRLVDVEAGGTLCSYLRFNQPGPQADVLAYSVNACNLPTTPLVYGDGEPVGYNVPGQVNTWAYPVLEPTRYALVAAAWAPNDATASWVYVWGVAVLPPPEEGSTEEVVCPAPPSEARR